MEELELLIATCRIILNCHFNLDLIVKKIHLDNIFVGKKLINVLEDGDIKKTKKRKSKINDEEKQYNDDNKEKDGIDNNSSEREDFSNQLTLILNIESHIKNLDNSLLSKSIENKISQKIKSESKNIINIKIFRNGKLMIVGGLSTDDSIYATNLFLNKISNISDQYKIDSNKKIEDIFKSTTKYMKFIKKNYLSIYYMFNIFNVDIDFMVSKILNIKDKCCLFTWKELLTNIYNPKDEYKNTFKQYNIFNEYDESFYSSYIIFSKIIQTLQMCLNYFDNDEIINKIKNNDDKFLHFINDLYNEKVVTIYPTFNEEVTTFITEIVNFNSQFACGYDINRRMLEKIINKKYHDNIISCSFDPHTYQGVNILYKSNILDENEKTVTNNKNSKNKKKYYNNVSTVSIFTFQSGKVIITGSKNWEKNLDAYNFIKNILINEKENICIKNNDSYLLENKIDLLPIKIYDREHIYLNSNEIIFKSPRNVKILKDLDLYDLYKSIYKPISV